MLLHHEGTWGLLPAILGNAVLAVDHARGTWLPARERLWHRRQYPLDMAVLYCRVVPVALMPGGLPTDLGLRLPAIETCHCFRGSTLCVLLELLLFNCHQGG